MKKIFSKGWFQVLFFGAIIGVVLIIIDNRYGLIGKKKEDDRTYHGPVAADKDNVFFSKIEFKETEYNFGTAKEGDTVKHVFHVRNSGKEPLLIYKVLGSCDCTGAGYTSDPIAPGGEATISAYFKTIGRKGPQTRTLRVTTNTDPPENVITLTGTVE